MNMKFIKKALLVLLLGLLVIPFNVSADSKKYQTMNLEEALTEESIEHDLSNYKETDDQVTIYLFRGKGCAYCRKFLTFINSIVDEYGQYFKVVSYEVWYNQDNGELMNKVADTMQQEAGGVPYIVIGDKVFAGYSEQYDADIKAQIKKLYETKKSKRYDVMEHLDDKEETKKEGNDMSFGFLAFTIIFPLALAAGVIVYQNKKYIDLEERLSALENKKNKSK